MIDLRDLPLRNSEDVAIAVAELVKFARQLVREVARVEGEIPPVDTTAYAALVHRHKAAEIDGLPSSSTIEFTSVQHRPTSLAGYGITDAAPLVHQHDFGTGITGKPNTLAGYGIGDAASLLHDHDGRYYPRPDVDGLIAALGSGLSDAPFVGRNRVALSADAILETGFNYVLAGPVSTAVGITLTIPVDASLRTL